MQKLKVFLQPYRPTNRPYQSLPQATLTLMLIGCSIAGLVTLNPMLLVPAVVMVIALETSAWFQTLHLINKKQES